MKVCGLVIGFCLLALAACFGREWSDATGKFRVEAELVRVTDGKVTLKKPDGTEVTVPLERLSKSDQDFAQKQSKPQANNDNPDDPLKLLAEQAEAQRTANDAAKLYAAKLASDVSQTVKDQLESKRAYWQDLANKKFVRFAGKWISLEEAKNYQTLEQGFMSEALRMFDVGNAELAIERLRKAGQANPHAIEPNFLLGLTHALLLRNPEEAEKQFASCIKRRMAVGRNSLLDSERVNLVSALNNLAITKVRSADYRGALQAWQQALELSPPTPEIIQNLGKMSQLPISHRRLNIPTTIARNAAELYARVAISSGAGKYEQGIGWLYMRFVDEQPCEEWLKTNAISTPPTVKTLAVKKGEKPVDAFLVGTGSGFVIGPKHVLTNRHVVEHADSLMLVSANSPEPLLINSVLQSSDSDLALVTCESLKAPALSFSDQPAKLGTELVALGFPVPNMLGQKLKASRGIISGLPDPSNPVIGAFLLFDAVINGGNSGGPVCDKRGRAIAVTTAVTLIGSKGASGGELGCGVPMDVIKKFIDSAAKDIQFTNAASGGAEKSWEDVIEGAAKSTVQILVYQNVKNMRIENELAAKRDGAAKKWKAYEDFWCISCNGNSLINCPARGCANGVTRSLSTQLLGSTAEGAAITRQKMVRDRCDTCRGIGKVDCPFCHHGIEH